MIERSVTEQMRRDWNDRAREDAHFYVAFGRRDQDPEEFFETAAEIVKGFEHELRRMPQHTNRRSWRALEIGCGPGRLMRPLSRLFGEIHGVDVSDEMIVRAQANLRDVPHAHAHHTSGADLSPFADASFDFVYSYAVFQHIPSRDVVLQYLTEAHRVLKSGGLLRVQINGLDESAQRYDTWSGVRISAREVTEFARTHNMQLFALEGTRTQYMWTTMRKREAAWVDVEPAGATRLRRLTNAHSSEPVAPPSGRFASVTLWLENLPADCDLLTLEIMVDGEGAFLTYIGPREADGLQQVNILLPRLSRTGLVPLDLLRKGERLCDRAVLRVVPKGPEVPFVLSVADGINLLSGTRITSRSVKVTVEELTAPELFSATLDGRQIEGMDVFCADPLPPRYEINFDLPDDVQAGPHQLEMRIGHRLLGSVGLDIAG